MAADDRIANRYLFAVLSIAFVSTNASFVLMSDAFVLMKGLCDTGQVRSLLLATDALMCTNDALLRTSDAFVRTSPSFMRSNASFVLTKDVMTVAALGTAISSLEK